MKTKGHALQHPTYLHDHPHLKQHALHNHAADRYADAARSLFFNPNFIILPQLLSARVEGYVVFLRAVHRIISRVYIASQRIKQSPSFLVANPQFETPQFVLHTTPTFATQHQSTFVKFKVTELLLQQYLDKAPEYITGFACFLRRCA
eukprot:1881385-Karenia_brevis.AAC.1